MARRDWNQPGIVGRVERARSSKQVLPSALAPSVGSLTAHSTCAIKMAKVHLVLLSARASPQEAEMLCVALDKAGIESPVDFAFSSEYRSFKINLCQTHCRLIT